MGIRAEREASPASAFHRVTWWPSNTEALSQFTARKLGKIGCSDEQRTSKSPPRPQPAAPAKKRRRAGPKPCSTRTWTATAAPISACPATRRRRPSRPSTPTPRRSPCSADTLERAEGPLPPAAGAALSELMEGAATAPWKDAASEALHRAAALEAASRRVVERPRSAAARSAHRPHPDEGSPC